MFWSWLATLILGIVVGILHFLSTLFIVIYLWTLLTLWILVCQNPLTKFLLGIWMICKTQILLLISYFSGLSRQKNLISLGQFFASFFNVDIGIEQGSALSPVLSALYLYSIFHIFEKRVKILKIPVLLISFVDNGLFVS